ncbi:MAG: universal stress protein [Natrialbaceae archaeon]|nr:universal stress protein [Natrialbaceae archaeon]
MALTFDGPLVMPVADPDDGERTARSLANRLSGDCTVIVVHVVERGSGKLDSVPVATGGRSTPNQYFERTRPPLEDTGATVQTEVLYGPDIVDTIFEAATDMEADSIVFIPREGSVLTEVLTGGVARRLVRDAELPVVVLPRESEYR